MENDHTQSATPPPYHAIYKEVRTQDVTNSLTPLNGISIIIILFYTLQLYHVATEFTCPI